MALCFAKPINLFLHIKSGGAFICTNFFPHAPLHIYRFENVDLAFFFFTHISGSQSGRIITSPAHNVICTVYILILQFYPEVLTRKFQNVSEGTVKFVCFDFILTFQKFLFSARHHCKI